MKISVIIPAYNEGKYIEECLDSIKTQNYDNDIEIILVDDGSTDDTLEIAEKHGVTILKQEHKGAGAARNLGAQNAKGNILVFIDGDMYLDKDAIGHMVQPIIDGSTIGTFFINEYVANMDNVWARCWNIAHNIPGNRRNPENKNVSGVSDVFKAIKKDVFIKSGGNHEERATGQDRIADRVGRGATYDEKAIVYHYNADSADRVYKDARKFGKGQIHNYKGIKIFSMILKYSIFRSIPAGIYKAMKFKEPMYFLFKVYFDFAVFVGFITALFTRDTKE